MGKKVLHCACRSVSKTERLIPHYKGYMVTAKGTQGLRCRCFDTTKDGFVISRVTEVFVAKRKDLPKKKRK